MTDIELRLPDWIKRYVKDDRHPVLSTARILALKVLNRINNQYWVEWAYEMLLAGFETENLIILTGMMEPFDYFEMQNLTGKVLAELNLDYTNKDKVIIQYTSYLTQQALLGTESIMKVLSELRNVYIELDYYDLLQEFYFLYYAKEDLIESEVQWYVNGVDRGNIDQVIRNYFKQWGHN